MSQYLCLLSLCNCLNVQYNPVSVLLMQAMQFGNEEAVQFLQRAAQYRAQVILSQTHTHKNWKHHSLIWITQTISDRLKEISNDKAIWFFFCLFIFVATVHEHSIRQMRFLRWTVLFSVPFHSWTPLKVLMH